jgi:hypothetical protein
MIMKAHSARLAFLIFIAATGLHFGFRQNSPSPVSFPYQQAGLSKKQAAAHLLSRFSFGANEAQVNMVAEMGPEKWFLQQLEANLPDDAVKKNTGMN